METVTKRWKIAPLVEAAQDAQGQMYIRHACTPPEGWSVVTEQNWGTWHRIADGDVVNPGMDFSIDIDLICGLCGLRGRVFEGKWQHIRYESYQRAAWKDQS